MNNRINELATIAYKAFIAANLTGLEAIGTEQEQVDNFLSHHRAQLAYNKAKQSLYAEIDRVAKQEEKSATSAKIIADSAAKSGTGTTAIEVPAQP